MGPFPEKEVVNTVVLPLRLPSSHHPIQLLQLWATPGPQIACDLLYAQGPRHRDYREGAQTCGQGTSKFLLTLTPVLQTESS